MASRAAAAQGAQRQDDTIGPIDQVPGSEPACAHCGIEYLEVYGMEDLQVCTDCKKSFCPDCFDGEEPQYGCASCGGRCEDCRAAKATLRCCDDACAAFCPACGGDECDGCNRMFCPRCAESLEECEGCGFVRCDNCAVSRYKGNCDCEVDRLNRELGFPSRC